MQTDTAIEKIENILDQVPDYRKADVINHLTGLEIPTGKKAIEDLLTKIESVVESTIDNFSSRIASEVKDDIEDEFKS